MAFEVLLCFEKYGIIEHQVILDTLDLQSKEEGHIVTMHTELDFKEIVEVESNQQGLEGPWDTDSDIYIINSS